MEDPIKHPCVNPNCKKFFFIPPELKGMLVRTKCECGADFFIGEYYTEVDKPNNLDIVVHER